ncbi:hypothetical protein BH20ACI2_BH20ACI2_14270 [soil metagenome]
MKTLSIAFAAGLLLVFLAGSGYAQKKTPKKPAVKKPAPTATIVPPVDVRAAREKVEVQLSNVNDFVNKLGTIARGLEVADADAKAGNLSAKTASKIETKKTEIVDAIRNIRYALTGLESEFRTKASLQKYLPTVQGITGLTSQSEDSAIAGKFVTARSPLIDVAQKLTDTLAVLPR